jgi:hypothetical protein
MNTANPRRLLSRHESPCWSCYLMLTVERLTTNSIRMRIELLSTVVSAGVRDKFSRCFLFYLTNPVGYWNIQMKTCSTIQVAKILEIGTDTLHRWMREKRVPIPPLQSVGGMSVRLWSDDDLAKARKYKEQHYWGKGGRKNRKKRSS